MISYPLLYLTERNRKYWVTGVWLLVFFFSIKWILAFRHELDPRQMISLSEWSVAKSWFLELWAVCRTWGQNLVLHILWCLTDSKKINLYLIYSAGRYCKICCFLQGCKITQVFGRVFTTICLLESCYIDHEHPHDTKHTNNSLFEGFTI